MMLVCIAYYLDIPTIFRKKQDGKISVWIRWAFLPFLIAVRFYNWLVIRRDKVEPIQQISDNLYLSRRLFKSDVDFLARKNITCIVDVTAEFVGIEGAMTEDKFDYLNVPVLDHKAPSLHRLRHAINWMDTHISMGNSVVVHCALGRGRSVFVVAAYLLSKDPSLNVEQVMEEINQIRSVARLNNTQLKVLSAIKRKKQLHLPAPAWLIANPIAGGGKWQSESEFILRELTKRYRFKVMVTSKQVSASQFAAEAATEDIKVVIACGGDGTVCEVAQKLVNTDVRLGVVPCGKANALSHVLYGLSAKVTPISRACEIILEDNIKEIDTAICNEHLMLLVVGLGIEQRMIEYANRKQKDKQGQMAYLAGFLNNAVSDKTLSVIMELDNKESMELEIHSLAIANTAPFTTLLAQGGEVPNVDDGKLHITYLKASESMPQQLLALSDLALSSLGVKHESDIFEYAQAFCVTILPAFESDLINYVVDGEMYSASKLNIRLQPKSLKVFSA